MLLFLPGFVSLVALSVQNLPAMQKAWVRFLDQEDALEKEMATHSLGTCLERILSCPSLSRQERIPWTEEPGRLESAVSQ